MAKTSEVQLKKITAEMELLARQLIALDSCIVMALVMDLEGKPLALESAREIPDLDKIRESQDIKQIGVMGVVLGGIANRVSGVLGEPEFVCYNFSKSKALAFRLRREKVMVLLRLRRSADERYVLSKVERALGCRIGL